MKNATETLLWVLRFIETDFEQYRAGDWMNFAEDLLQFFGWGLPGEVISQDVAPLKDLQNRVRARLDDFADCPPPPPSPFSIPGSPDETHRSFEIPEAYIHNLRLLFYEKKKWKIDVDVAPNSFYATQFLVTLGMALTTLHESGKLDRLRRCQGPGVAGVAGVDGRKCKKLFFAEHGRQRFCSVQCKGKKHSQRFRARHSEELRAKAHSRYEKKIKAIHPNTKVGQHRKVKKRKETTLNG